MKLVQFLLMPVNMANVDVIDPEYAYLFDKDSERGDGGFGSTGLD
jgi:dUTPase